MPCIIKAIRFITYFFIDRIFEISPMNGKLSKNHPKILELREKLMCTLSSFLDDKVTIKGNC